ncbi:general transcription factor 3C polypeptide 1 isoform X2 [Megachile rotundata]|uniref:general transcription factor 3C polypeptide 1 isoform X2 n=1 Tax=Megachile rotundata TaxID=143995 RepID=UPI000614FD25|nr:PREDICTED: general transcription factor 3C polypeptide 1 isoform X2 [Megachile rotundata]
MVSYPSINLVDIIIDEVSLEGLDGITIEEYDEIKRKLQIENAIKKLFKTSFFQKVVKTDIRVPYRTLYPNAKPEEWRLKNTPLREKKIKVVQLLFPDIDILEAWNKDEIQEDDEPQELDISSHKYGLPYLKQANKIIEAGGNDGVCQGGLSKIMGLTKLQSRTILRSLVKTNIVATYMNDFGRQRVTKYVSKKYEKGSKLSKQFKKEMHKIKEFKKQIPTETDDVEESKIIKNINPEQEEKINTNDQKENIQQTKSNAVCEVIDINCNAQAEERSNVTAVELQKVFYVVNRILYKYRIIKRPNRYKQTCSKHVSSTVSRVEVKEKDINSDNLTLGMSELSKKQKSATAYKNIKVDLTVLTTASTAKSENEIFGFIEDVQNCEKKNFTNITYRLLKRANMIIESVKQHQVIDDMTKLIKMIHEEEDKEGYDVKIDKKSLIRLLQKLAKDNLIKNIKVVLSANGKEKSLTFICDPNIDVNSAVIQSAIEQAKLKFYLLGSHRHKTWIKKMAENTDVKNTNADDVTDNFESNKSPFKLPTTLPPSCKIAARVSRKYGYSPKFLRMQALHIFLFYLVYEHPGEPLLSQTEYIKALKNNDFNISEELIEEFSKIYTNDVSWKMFVPPLPKYTGWPAGWTLMCDILLRLPLSVFFKVHYISYTVPEIEKYINHPIRKHYLVRDLPIDIRNSLLYARKYIFNIHETVTRLCYIGLVQFGPQKLKEKDQVFIYINRHAELMDTTSSAPSYHMVQDKSYPVTKYNFTEIQVVEKYWYDMWNICINTPLGGRLAVEGKDIVLEDLSKKSDMIQAVVARSPEEAVKLDIGKMPGDRKGAAGIDSACFAHLKRNWNWSITSATPQTKKKQSEVYERDKYLSKIKVKPLKFTEFAGLKTVCGPPSVNVTELRKKIQPKTEESSNQHKKYEVLACQRSAKQKSYVRRVLPRKCNSKRRTKYDEIDYRALQRMHKLRVDWEPHEDKILLVCKIVMMYLCSNPRRQVITFSTVRDILRIYSYTSYNKTSRACQRRLLYMLRQQRNVDAVALGVEELKQNFFIKKRFDGIIDKLKEEYKNSLEYERQVTETFKYLVAYTAKKYYGISDVESKEPIPVPNTVQEFNLLYKVVHPMRQFSNRGFTKDVRNINDIHFVVINSVIHSSMCCGKDRRSWAYQLFKVYQQYPEMLLRNAMAKIRSDQMVSIRKHHLAALRKYGNYMPMSSSQYQLSSNYMYKFQSKWPYSLFNESYDVFLKLSNRYCENQLDNQMKESNNFNGIEVLPVTGGIVGAIHDYVVRDQLDFDIEIPDQVIMLDPRLKEKDETYFRIAQRYQDVLASLDNLKFVKEPSLQNSSIDKCFNSTADILDDTDTHNVDVKSDKNGFLDLGRETNILSEECAGKKRNFEDAKHLMNYDDLNFDSEEENGRNIDDEHNIIKLQDGTKIVLNKDDLEGSTFCDENSAIEVAVDLSNNSKTHDETKSTDQISKSKNGSQMEDNCKPLSKNINTDEAEIIANTESIQEKFITPEKKRPRDDKQLLDPCEPAHKRTKLDSETVDIKQEKSTEELQSNNVSIEVSDEVQNEDLGKHSNNEVVEMTDAKLNTNDLEPNCKETTLSKEPKTPQLKKSSEHTYTRVSDILKNIPLEQSYLNSSCKIDDSTDIDKRYTRIALLRMRVELSELTAADSHHAHEYFVVNMFKVLYSLYTKSQDSKENEIFRGLSLPRDLLPLNLNAANDFVQEINKYAVFPKDGISYSDFKKKLPKDLSLSLNNIEMVYKFVRDKQEIGASIQELINEFESSLGEDLRRITTLLTEHRLFLRSGVTTVRYIHYGHADPWLIHSYKIFRLEKESLVPVPKGTVYLTDTKEMVNESSDVSLTEECNKNPSSSESGLSKIDVKDETEMDIKSEAKCQRDEEFDKDMFSHSDDDSTVQVKKRMQRKRTRLLPQKDISRAVKQLDLNTKQEVKVVMKPWIRIDGVLNRRVLDRMLGSVLSYCLTHPGIALSKLQNRFIPVLQPFHTRELAEMLVKLGCMEKIILKKSRVTLFSKPSPVKPKITNDDWAIEEDIFFEPTNGAILKFGIFLSTKMYTTDFIT